jgi:hypothetical protein
MSPELDQGPDLPGEITDQAAARGVLESPFVWQFFLLCTVVVAFLLLRKGTRTGR